MAVFIKAQQDGVSQDRHSRRSEASMGSLVRFSELGAPILDKLDCLSVQSPLLNKGGRDFAQEILDSLDLNRLNCATHPAISRCFDNSRRGVTRRVESIRSAGTFRRRSGVNFLRFGGIAA